tara:strand:+ start:1110 stop:1277 length:168 start_codon:yes stop_codon:yes gene_type:complete
MKQQLNEVGTRVEVSRTLVLIRSLSKDLCTELHEVTYDDGNTAMIEVVRRVDDLV